MNPVTLIEQFLRKQIDSIKQVGGGSINEAYKIITADNQEFFCKINSSIRFPGMFAKEKNGLYALRSTSAIGVPHCLIADNNAQYQVLILEWITPGERTSGFWKTFGEQLAALHSNKGTAYGFFEDNYMGALPQDNTYMNGWADFFINKRIVPQAQLAFQKGYLTPSQVRKIESFCGKISALFSEEHPVLVHGDLWGGNFICNKKQQPLLIDPAVYYGNRNIDLAMTTLFGGFDRVFYDSYQYHFPFPPDHLKQWRICNLYPLFVHLNLFGKSYLPDIIGTIDAY